MDTLSYYERTADLHYSKYAQRAIITAASAYGLRCIARFEAAKRERAITRRQLKRLQELRNQAATDPAAAIEYQRVVERYCRHNQSLLDYV